MKPSRVRLLVCALLFVGWIGWLVYLSATTTRPVVLSRPQFLASGLWVLADVHADPKKPNRPADEIIIRELVWPRAEQGVAGNKMVVENLHLCGPDQGWTGPGEYLLPLTQVREEGGRTSYPGPTHLIGQSLGAQALAPGAGPMAPVMQALVAAQVVESGAFALRAYRVTPVPRSPGFDRRLLYRPIYPATAAARRDLKELSAEFHRR
jgi:hypothetical protein